ncbi:MAG: dihydropteroate synthase [Saprospiraceae bacterium]|nr:dihydropteroate synthase [Saprospiraceae bacterium]
MIEQHTTLNCNGTLLELSSPIVMGIINVTPDSFYADSRASSVEQALRLAETHLEEGATILDVGGMSSRPGAEIIGVEEELNRVLPIIKALKARFPETVISLDTIRAEVAAAGVEAGAGMINDISAGSLDENLFSTVTTLNVPYILMHMQGRPSNMQSQPTYDNLVQDIFDFFVKKVGELRALGLKDIIIDPGFGFGKQLEHNYTLLQSMHVFQVLGLPILTGLSRKSMIYKLLEVEAAEALIGTAALHMVALQQGSKILRVHDVREANEVIKLWSQLENH